MRVADLGHMEARRRKRKRRRECEIGRQGRNKNRRLWRSEIQGDRLSNQ